MKTIEIIEARKNPELNPKVSINQYIRQAYAAADLLPNTNRPIKNLFVSFVKVPKLGINPQSKYDTPLGIYSYPADYVLERIGDTGSMNDLPFAGNQPYAAIFSAYGNIVDISSMSNQDEKFYYDKLREFAKSLPDPQFDIFYLGENWPSLLERFITSAPSKAKFGSRAGGRLWYVTYKFSNFYGPKYGQQPIVAWNKLFRTIGIDGCVDDGVGIIHESERTQAVFFSMKPLRVLSIVNNKYSPENVSLYQEVGQRTQEIITDFKRDINIAMKNDDVEILKPYLMRERIDPNYWDWQKLFKYIPKKLRYKLYDDPSKLYNKMFWSTGKNLDPDEFEYAMKKNLTALVYISAKLPKNVAFINQHKERVLAALKSATAQQLYDLPEWFADTLIIKLPWNNFEYLKYLLYIDRNLLKNPNFIDVMRKTPNKKKLYAFAKNPDLYWDLAK